MARLTMLGHFYKPTRSHENGKIKWLEQCKWPYPEADHWSIQTTTVHIDWQWLSKIGIFTLPEFRMPGLKTWDLLLANHVFFI